MSIPREPFCPIVKGPCIARECAMAVRLERPGMVVWQCGLVTEDGRKARVIWSEEVR